MYLQMSPAPSSNPPSSPIVVVDVVGAVTRRKVIVYMLCELCVTVEVAICSFNQVV